MKGYGGRVLNVDLTTGATRIEALDEGTARALLGGNGLAARLLYDRVPAGIDPFDAGQRGRLQRGADHGHDRAGQQPRLRREQSRR